MIKWAAHLRTITHHRLLVMRYCFRVGLYWQGLTHDLSKYAPVEFLAGARYYQGNRSPNEMERKICGYSAAWLHHKGRNKHHMEYWIDYSAQAGYCIAGMQMPVRYVAEMVCDRIAASKIYGGKSYTDSDPYAYYARSHMRYVIHPRTDELLEQLLARLRDHGETALMQYMKHELLPRAHALDAHPKTP